MCAPQLDLSSFYNKQYSVSGFCSHCSTEMVKMSKVCIWMKLCAPSDMWRFEFDTFLWISGLAALLNLLRSIQVSRAFPSDCSTFTDYLQPQHFFESTLRLFVLYFLLVSDYFARYNRLAYNTKGKV